MATVTFSAADDLLYAYLAGEIDHDAAQNLRIQLMMPFWPAPPKRWCSIWAGLGLWIRPGWG